MSDTARRPQHMLLDDIQRAFTARGWKRGAGGHLYFNGLGTATHPHLHLILSGPRPLVGRDVRLAVGMLAWSFGQQHLGVANPRYIWNDGNAHDRNAAAPPQGNPAVVAEWQWIMNYFTQG